MIDFLPQNDGVMIMADVMALNPLVLAFVGDSVQQLMVRTKLASTTTLRAGELHKLATAEIKAPAQAIVMDRIIPHLTTEEHDIFRRTRNTKMNTMAKHASIAEYKKASGYEAVIGYLYLLGRNERLRELIALGAINTEEGICQE